MTATGREAEKLAKDVKSVMRDAEDLLRATGEDLSDKTQEARKKLRDTLENAKCAYNDAQEKLIKGWKKTDKTIHRNPYPALGIAAGVGIVIGYLLSRK